MNSAQHWVPEEQAAKQLGIAHSTIRLMRRERKLLPGEHWIFATGKPNGPVHYDIAAIRKHLVELTIAAAKEEDQRRKQELTTRRNAVETYDAPHLDQLIAEVQS